MSIFALLRLAILLPVFFTILPLGGDAHPLKGTVFDHLVDSPKIFHTRTNPFIEALVDSVSEEEILSSLENLEGFFTRHSISDTLSDSLGIGAARRWVFGKFQEFAAPPGSSLQPSYFDFEETICSVQGSHRNIMATLPGTMPVSIDRIFLVGGHLDSRTRGSCDFESFAPGTNDDGSGTAAVIELARVLSLFDFDATLMFMASTGEEQGLFGSTAYAEFARENDLRIDGMINNDTIGNIANDNGEVDSTSVRHYSDGPPDSPSRQLARYMKLKGEQYVPGFTVNLIPAQDRPGRGGDHIAFNDNGYAAARLIETNESFDHQHNETDLLANMHIPYLVKVVRVNVAGLACLALAPASPTGLDVADLGSGTELYLSWPPSNNEPDFAGYRVAVRMADSLYYDQIVAVGDTTEYTLTNLNNGESVYVSISALDTDDNESIFSQEVLATPRSVPSPPSDLESTSLLDRIILEWAPNKELDLKGYTIYRTLTSGAGYDSVAFVAEPDTTWSDSGVDPLTFYYYRIKAVDNDDFESEFSDEVKGRLATHDSGIMIVDATRDGSGGPLQPTDEQVDAFYESMLSPYNLTSSWDRADSTAMGISLTDADLGIYSTLVWHSDLTNGVTFRDTTAIRKFLNGNGKMLLIGWNLAEGVGGSAGFSHTFPAGSFMHEYVKVDSARTTAVPEADFIGAEPIIGGYPALEVDTAKVTLFNGNLHTMDIFLPPLVGEPVTEVIYGYRSSLGDTSSNHGLPVGLKYFDNDLWSRSPGDD
jgi:hypothetical protein